VTLTMNGSQAQLVAGAPGASNINAAGALPVGSAPMSGSSVIGSPGNNAVMTGAPTNSPGMYPRVPGMQPGGTPSGGVRVLSGGQARSLNTSPAPTAMPPAPPGGVGARLYRPPPTQ
jgi:hypothetical protein